MKAPWKFWLVLALASWPGAVLAQLRPQREPFDMSGFAVVGGLFVLGVVAYLLARGRNK